MVTRTSAFHSESPTCPVHLPTGAIVRIDIEILFQNTIFKFVPSLDYGKTEGNMNQ
jgi:hypothetical protein